MSYNKHFEILKKVYDLTSNTVPRRFDCGELCNKLCCQNLSTNDIPTGMNLLPHERDFLIYNGAEYSYSATKDGDFVVCNGKCDRNLRPFACRIFPYYIKISENKILLKKDLRAANVCPLLYAEKNRRANIYFIRSIKKAARLLLKEKCYRDEFISISDFVEYLYDFYNKLEK